MDFETFSGMLKNEFSCAVEKATLTSINFTVKKFIAATLGLMVLCIKTGAQSSAVPQTSKLQWLIGTWSRANAKPGKSGYETWQADGRELKGHGLTMQGSDTVAFEKIRIAERDGTLFYLADVPENKKEVAFRMTKVTRYEFVCENPDHDFPKRIHYKLSGTKLTATISGNGRSIEYLFERTN